MRELFYTDDFFGIYEKLDEDNVRCVALMDSSAAPDLTIAETERYAKLFVAAPDLLLEAKCALADLEGVMEEFEPSGDREHPAWDTIDKLRAVIARVEG